MFGFRPLFFFAGEVMSFFLYAVIIVKTVLKTPNNWAKVTDAPAKQAPMICHFFGSLTCQSTPYITLTMK